MQLRLVEKGAVRWDVAEVEARLAELGFTIGELAGAVTDGHAARENCPPNYPPVVRGLVGYGATISGLRDRKLAHGWKKSDYRNFSTVFHEGRRIAVTVAMGDDATGRRGSRDPRTKHDHGQILVEAANRNVDRRQLDLFKKPTPPEAIEELAIQPSATWLLLVAVVGGEIRSELSLPSPLSEDGYAETWLERNILPPIPLAGPIEPSTPPPPFEPDPGPEIDIEVERRTE